MISYFQWFQMKRMHITQRSVAVAFIAFHWMDHQLQIPPLFIHIQILK